MSCLCKWLFLSCKWWYSLNFGSTLLILDRRGVWCLHFLKGSILDWSLFRDYGFVFQMVFPSFWLIIYWYSLNFNSIVLILDRTDVWCLHFANRSMLNWSIFTDKRFAFSNDFSFVVNDDIPWYNWNLDSILLYLNKTEVSCLHFTNRSMLDWSLFRDKRFAFSNDFSFLISKIYHGTV